MCGAAAAEQSARAVGRMRDYFPAAICVARRKMCAMGRRGGGAGMMMIMTWIGMRQKRRHSCRPRRDRLEQTKNVAASQNSPNNISGKFLFCFSYVAKVGHSCVRNKEFPPFLGRVYDANVNPVKRPPDATVRCGTSCIGDRPEVPESTLEATRSGRSRRAKKPRIDAAHGDEQTLRFDRVMSAGDPNRIFRRAVPTSYELGGTFRRRRRMGRTCWQRL